MQNKMLRFNFSITFFLKKIPPCGVNLFKLKSVRKAEILCDQRGFLKNRATAPYIKEGELLRVPKLEEDNEGGLL